MRGRRSVWAVAAGIAATGLLVVAVVLGSTGYLGQLRADTDPVAVPVWDTVRDFRFAFEQQGYPRLEISREAGAERFTVTATTARTRELDGSAVEGLRGTELFRGPGINVLLTPAPPGLEPFNTYWVFSPTDAGGPLTYGTTRVAEHGSQALLVQVLVSQRPLPDDGVGDIAWLVDEAVGLASGAPVRQVEAESGDQRLIVWRSPEAGLLGHVREPPGRRLIAAELDRGRLYAAPVPEGEDAETGGARQWRYTVLPDGAGQVTAVLDDSVGTVMPFETVPLGSETLAYRLLDGVDVDRAEAGYWNMTWVDAGGEQRLLAELSPEFREQTKVRLGQQIYFLREDGRKVTVSGGDVVLDVLLTPENGTVARETTPSGSLVVIPGWDPDIGDPVLVPRSRGVAGMEVLEGAAQGEGTLQPSGVRVRLALLPAPEGAVLDPHAALGLTRDGERCRLTAPEALEATRHGLRAGGLSGTLLHLADLEAWGLCLGDVAAGGLVADQPTGGRFTGEDDRQVVVWAGDGGAAPDFRQEWQVDSVEVSEDLTILVAVWEP